MKTEKNETEFLEKLYAEEIRLHELKELVSKRLPAVRQAILGFGGNLRDTVRTRQRVSRSNVKEWNMSSSDTTTADSHTDVQLTGSEETQPLRNETKSERVAEIVRAINGGTKNEIVDAYLKAYPENDRAKVDKSVSLILGRLKKDGLVNADHEGKNVLRYYV